MAMTKIRTGLTRILVRATLRSWAATIDKSSLDKARVGTSWAMRFLHIRDLPIDK